MSIPSWNEDSFRHALAQPGIIVARFSTAWCTVCHSTRPAWQRFVELVGEEALCGEVDMLQAPVLTDRYQIWGQPSVLFFRDGQLVHRLPGVHSAKDYLGALRALQTGISLKTN